MKVLTLELYYKGQNINYAKEGIDFKDKFYIGSDKNLLWQILDRSFPLRHQLISKSGNQYRMRLLKGMNVEIRKDDQILSLNDLKSKKMIMGNDLVLDESTRGKISFLNDWEIEYHFKEPFRPTLTKQLIGVVKELRRYPPIEPYQRFTLAFMIIAMILTFAGLTYLEVEYGDVKVKVQTSSVVYADPTQQAYAVQLDAISAGDDEGIGTVDEGPGEEEAAEEPAEEAPAGPPQPSAAAAGLMAGGIGGGGDDGGGEDALQAALLYSSIKGSGSPLGDGVAVSGGSQDGGLSAADLFKAKGGAGAGGDGGPGVANAFNAGDVGGGGLNIKPGSLVGAPSGMRGLKYAKSMSEFNAMAAGKYGGGIKKLKEPTVDISQNDPDDVANQGGTQQRIRQTVRAKTYRLKSIVKSYSTKFAVGATLYFRIIIKPNGTVDDVFVQAEGNPNYPAEVLNALAEEVRGWKFNIQESVPVDFPFKLAVGF